MIDKYIYDFGFRTGIDMYKPNSDGSDIVPDAVKTMCWHYVTITGVYTNTQIGKVFLKVQSWGKVYYIDYEELNEYNSGFLNSARLIFVS